jgi:hypothetical protein
MGDRFGTAGLNTQQRVIPRALAQDTDEGIEASAW